MDSLPKYNPKAYPSPYQLSVLAHPLGVQAPFILFLFIRVAAAVSVLSLSECREKQIRRPLTRVELLLEPEEVQTLPLNIDLYFVISQTSEFISLS